MSILLFLNTTNSFNCTEEVQYLQERLTIASYTSWIMLALLVLISICSFWSFLGLDKQKEKLERRLKEFESKRKKENKTEPNAEQLLHVLDTTSDDLELSVELSTLEVKSTITDHEIMTVMEEVKNNTRPKAVP